MVILITGASHTGKTILAQRLLEKCHIPYLSIDHLKMGLIRSGCTALTPEDDDALTAYLWPVVREIMKRRSKTVKTSSWKAATCRSTGEALLQNVICGPYGFSASP